MKECTMLSKSLGLCLFQNRIPFIRWTPDKKKESPLAVNFVFVKEMFKRNHCKEINFVSDQYT